MITGNYLQAETPDILKIKIKESLEQVNGKNAVIMMSSIKNGLYTLSRQISSKVKDVVACNSNYRTSRLKLDFIDNRAVTVLLRINDRDFVIQHDQSDVGGVPC